MTVMYVPPSSRSLQETGVLTLDALEPRGLWKQVAAPPGAEPGVARPKDVHFQQGPRRGTLPL